MSENKHKSFFDKVEMSAVYTIVGIIFLFSFSVAIILLTPLWTEKSWISPSSPYQVQMYEVADPNFFISNSAGTTYDLQFVNRLVKDETLIAFKESESVRILASPELEKYVTKSDEPTLKLTSNLLLLRKPTGDYKAKAEKINQELQQDWEKTHAKDDETFPPSVEIFELYDPGKKDVFTVASTDGILENWASQDYKILDPPKQHWHTDKGVIYVNNPREYLIRKFTHGGLDFWEYDPNKGVPIKSVDELMQNPFGFLSRKELIQLGENVYKVEGCWYCHTDQTRTLIQDTVLNGSDSFPAPPSSPNEYIYQEVTFPGTKRNGPDLSRVGIKKPSRDWHKGHFWSPKTASKGSIMPSFRHFFDFDPRGTSKNAVGVPNQKFEAIYQYLMTKGTRITAPSEGWWIGKDPVDTIGIIEGRKTVP